MTRTKMASTMTTTSTTTMKMTTTTTTTMKKSLQTQQNLFKVVSTSFKRRKTLSDSPSSESSRAAIKSARPGPAYSISFFLHRCSLFKSNSVHLSSAHPRCSYEDFILDRNHSFLPLFLFACDIICWIREWIRWSVCRNNLACLLACSLRISIMPLTGAIVPWRPGFPWEFP